MSPNDNPKTTELFRTTLSNDYEHIEQLGKDFERRVQRPIEMRETLMKNGEIQRCLEHNIIFSIYCTICRKALCASCMYNNNLHRKHRVAPLESAYEEVREDIKTFEAKLPKVVQQCEGLITSNNQYLVKFEKDFTPILVHLEEFYDNLHKELKVIKKQQLQALKEKQDLLRSEINAYNRELSKISQYVAEKYKSYIKYNLKTSLLVPARSVLQSLVLAGDFVKAPLVDLEKHSFQLTQNRIKKTHEDIMYKLAGLTLDFEPKIDSSKIKKSRVSPRKGTRTVSFAESPIPPGRKRDKDIFEKKRGSSSVAGMRTYR